MNNQLLKEIEKAERIEFYLKCFLGGYALGVILGIIRLIKKCK